MSTVFFDPSEKDSVNTALTTNTNTTVALPTAYGLGLSENSLGTNTLLETSPTLESFAIELGSRIK